MLWVIMSVHGVIECPVSLVGGEFVFFSFATYPYLFSERQMICRPLYIAGAVRDDPRRQAVLMIVPRPRRRRGAAASLVLGDHLVSFPDVVRHHSSHHLLHP